MIDPTFVEKIHWLGHDCIRIDSDPVIYFDPYEIDPGVEAGILLITHDHYDHCSVDDVKKILGKDTVIVTEKGSAATLTHALGPSIEGQINILAPGEKIEIKGVSIFAVPSYNLNKEFHPKEKNWLGFVVDVEGRTVYHAGDTDLIPEMADVSCDIALLPVSGTYVMTADEAVQAALKIAPKLAIPMHYGSLVGDEGDAAAFQKGLDGKVAVKVLSK
ncbi:L-ascorbate metabolism protein UlaG, beta-lactamase superfamily [Desulfocicer vacuolatum DSM 3385]|uniref:L-ascorbate metabolism protein UlaG, beta-lactamase superfamily n=1 Tax=Desulfocicer vacuolatum DSM 3385 TaxID=1121400 RepID=A0A1W2CXQ6_9BACT|nr:MBL fold metallo-hydrolase [Desulfocicer vacuolatum]SMC89987.1 L-ascorbate metabolism protein UlaG, beta-lactamase superfamily [Desulfocicer vacuolatum DSM 3385]